MFITTDVRQEALLGGGGQAAARVEETRRPTSRGAAWLASAAERAGDECAYPTLAKVTDRVLSLRATNIPREIYAESVQACPAQALR